MATARFPPADDENAPGELEGSELVLPQAQSNAGGEQMYRQEKRTETRREQGGEKKGAETNSKADYGWGETRLRKKEKEQDK